MQRFRAGDLEGAIALLEPLDRAATNSGNRFSDSLRETWNRNRLEAERLDQLVDAGTLVGSPRQPQPPRPPLVAGPDTTPAPNG